MLGSQKPYFEKLGLGYEKEENEKLSKSSQGKAPTCIYFFKKGHSYEMCISRRKAKKQKVKNPKKLTNSKGLEKMWVPKLKVMQMCLKSRHQKEMKWHLDSDYSRHMTGNRSWLKTLDPRMEEL